MQVRPCVFLALGLFLVPGANAALLTNTFHFEGSFNEGLSYTLSFVSQPNPWGLPPTGFSGTPLVEDLKFPVSVTFPEAPAGSKILTTAIRVDGAIVPWKLKTEITPIQVDCGGVPCHYEGPLMEGTSPKVYIDDSKGIFYDDYWIPESGFAGQTVDRTVWVNIGTRGFSFQPINAKAEYTFSGPSTYSITVTTATEYELLATARTKLSCDDDPCDRGRRPLKVSDTRLIFDPGCRSI